jgi:hypothetical protein
MLIQSALILLKNRAKLLNAAIIDTGLNRLRRQAKIAAGQEKNYAGSV